MISEKDENAINNGKHFNLSHFRSSRPEVFCKKGAVRNFAKFARKSICQSFFIVKKESLYVIKRETLTQVFVSEFCEISKNTSGGCFCHLSKYFDKFYGNVVHKMQVKMSNFIQVPASLAVAAISEFWFLVFSTHTIYNW